jgi:hypothetical protein
MRCSNDDELAKRSTKQQLLATVSLTARHARNTGRPTEDGLSLNRAAETQSTQREAAEQREETHAGAGKASV